MFGTYNKKELLKRIEGQKREIARLQANQKPVEPRHTYEINTGVKKEIVRADYFNHYDDAVVFYIYEGLRDRSIKFYSSVHSVTEIQKEK